VKRGEKQKEQDESVLVFIDSSRSLLQNRFRWDIFYVFVQNVNAIFGDVFLVSNAMPLTA
jgi:hypothetical protein